MSYLDVVMHRMFFGTMFAIVPCVFLASLIPVQEQTVGLVLFVVSACEVLGFAVAVVLEDFFMNY